ARRCRFCHAPAGRQRRNRGDLYGSPQADPYRPPRDPAPARDPELRQSVLRECSMMRAIIGTVIVALLTVSGYAQNFSPDELAARNVQRRAVEAMIWAMPAVNTDLMLQAMLGSTNAKVNEIVYWSKPVNWKNQTLTPNPDSIYFMSFWNVKDGPIVLEIP